MPKYTLLQLTQKILSSMDGDEVNSISDTTEAGQVVDIIETCYYDIASIGELPRDDDLFQLQASGNILLPVSMTLPADVADIRWIKYNNATVAQPQVNYQPVKPMPLYEFIQMVGSQSAASNIVTYTHTVNSDTFTFYANNDRAPQFYTTTNDNTLLFDGYDAAVDSTLQKSKTLCFGQKEFSWTAQDTFVPFLDDKQSQRLLHEAKALAFAELKQSQHANASKSAREIKIDQQSSKHKINTQSAYQQLDIPHRYSTMHTKPTGRYK